MAAMKKQRVEYSSPVDALVAVAKRLSLFEHQYKMNSETFFNKYQKGHLDDDNAFIDWANDYQHYFAIHQIVEAGFQHAA